MDVYCDGPYRLNYINHKTYLPQTLITQSLMEVNEMHSVTGCFSVQRELKSTVLLPLSTKTTNIAGLQGLLPSGFTVTCNSGFAYSVSLYTNTVPPPPPLTLSLHLFSDIITFTFNTAFINLSLWPTLTRARTSRFRGNRAYF